MKTYTSIEMCGMLGIKCKPTSHNHSALLQRAEALGLCRRLGRSRWVPIAAAKPLPLADKSDSLAAIADAMMEIAQRLKALCSSPAPSPADQEQFPETMYPCRELAIGLALWPSKLADTAKAAGLSFPVTEAQAAQLANAFRDREPALSGLAAIPHGSIADSSARTIGWCRQGDQFVASPAWGALRSRFGLAPCKGA